MNVISEETFSASLAEAIERTRYRFGVHPGAIIRYDDPRAIGIAIGVQQHAPAPAPPGP